MTLQVSEVVVRGRATWLSEYLLPSVFQLVGSLLPFGQGWPGASSEHLKQPKVVVEAILYDFTLSLLFKTRLLNSDLLASRGLSGQRVTVEARG